MFNEDDEQKPKMKKLNDTTKSKWLKDNELFFFFVYALHLFYGVIRLKNCVCMCSSEFAICKHFIEIK